MTNGDWIRKMTDEELAKHIARFSICFCYDTCPHRFSVLSKDDCGRDCQQEIEQWLKQEHEDE